MTKNKEVKSYQIRSAFGQCDLGALVDVWCPYAVHRAVMIIFIDCFYSCWKRDRVLAEDEVDLGKCAAIDLMSEEEYGTRWQGVWMNSATSVLSQPGAHQAL